MSDLVIGFVSGGHPALEFMFSVLRTVLELGCDVKAVRSGPGVFRSRNEMTEMFLETSSQFLLVVDDDVVWDPSDVWYLRGLLDDYPDAGGASGLLMTHATGSGFSLVGGIWDDESIGEYRRFAEVPTGLVLDAAAGAGFLLLRREAIIAVGSKPWTHIPGLSEDVSFLWRMRKAGYPLILDPSIQPGHIKELELRVGDMV